MKNLLTRFTLAGVACLAWAGSAPAQPAAPDEPLVVNGCPIWPYTRCPGADLRHASLVGANLVGADLRGADLRDADLRGTDLRGAKGCYLSCPTEGSFIGWKKASGHIVKLRIPEDARRSSATGHKCRCDKAYVMEIQNMDGTKATEDTVRADHDKDFVYTVGATVEVPDFDDNRWSECAPGIHFFIDRRAAVEY